MLPMLGVLSARDTVPASKLTVQSKERRPQLAVWQANISTADLAVLYVTLMSD